MIFGKTNRFEKLTWTWAQSRPLNHCLDSSYQLGIPKLFAFIPKLGVNNELRPGPTNSGSLGKSLLTVTGVSVGPMGIAIVESSLPN